MRQSALFPIFRRGNDRFGRSLAAASLERNVTNASDEVEGGTGAARRASHPLAASASGGGTAAAASSLSIAARRSETRASIDGSAGEMESGGDTTTPAWRLLAAATHPPLSASASGGGTAAAANSLSVVDACSETRTPTDELGQSRWLTHPRMPPWRSSLAAMPLPLWVFCWPRLLVVKRAP